MKIKLIIILLFFLLPTGLFAQANQATVPSPVNNTVDNKTDNKIQGKLTEQNLAELRTIDAKKNQENAAEQSLTKPQEQSIEQPKQKTDVSELVNTIQKALSTAKSNKLQSLMLDRSEVNEVERAIDALKNGQVYAPITAATDTNGAVNNAAQTPETEKQDNEKSYIYLSSIMYFTPQNWVVWIGDKKISTATNEKSAQLFLKSIQRDSVKVLWTLPVSKWKILSGKSEESAPKINENNQVEVEFELRPNQTYVASSNQVIEGRTIIPEKAKEEEVKKIQSTIIDPSKK